MVILIQMLSSNCLRVHCFISNVNVADMRAAVLQVHINGTDLEEPLAADSVIDAAYVFDIPGTLVVLGDAMVVLSLPQDVEIMGAAVSAGTWFAYIPGYLYVKALSCLQPAAKGF